MYLCHFVTLYLILTNRTARPKQVGQSLNEKAVVQNVTGP